MTFDGLHHIVLSLHCDLNPNPKAYLDKKENGIIFQKTKNILKLDFNLPGCRSVSSRGSFLG